jgi:hypothetical protein
MADWTQYSGTSSNFTLGNIFGNSASSAYDPQKYYSPDEGVARRRANEARKAEIKAAKEGAITDPVTQYQTDYAAARAANESRYQDILGQSEAAYTRNMGYLDKYGQQQSADINQRYSDLGASAVQDLTSRGLGNTTVTATTATGIANQASAEQRRLAEDVAQQKLAADTSLTQAKLGVMERKTDAYPDLNTYLQMSEYLNPTTTTKLASNYVYGGQSTGKASPNKGFDTKQLSNRQSMAYNY